ncbi:hypothetical protein [Paenibacillus solani]|uniref:hypothetical protein n=1 Tax=Paenibacillus solani TaxID=1705565 RepID=UPI000B279838|nr:hypothetical protein [Paenibacillus solani]
MVEGIITADSVYFEDHLCSTKKYQTFFLDAESNQFVKDIPVYSDSYQSPPIDLDKEVLMKVGYSAFLMLGVLIYVILWILDFVNNRRKAR